MSNIDKARQKLRARQRELSEFDKLPVSEKAKRRNAGLDPYEPVHIRNRKKAAELERRKRQFDIMPVEVRKVFEKIGWSPYRKEDVPVYRVCGTLSAK